MRELGRIVRLQIQRSSLKTGEKPRRSYDPAPLLAVDRVALGPDGVLGEEPGGGAWLVDVHHRAHPETKNEDGVHGVSLGFTSHYSRPTAARSRGWKCCRWRTRAGRSPGGPWAARSRPTC